MSQADVGALLGLTQQSVARIEAKALRKVRVALGEWR
jgi:DNA-directed RNA polymerase specialized sigma subunit